MLDARDFGVEPASEFKVHLAAQQASSNQAKAAAWGGVASGVGDVLGSLAGGA